MKAFGILILLLSFGCKTNRGAESTCDADFDVFFEKFGSDSLFQKANVNFPIIEYYSDEDFPLDLMETYIDEDDFVFTDFSKDANIYKISTTKQLDSVFYDQNGINSEYHLTYKFASLNGCWKLVELCNMTN